MIGAAMVAKSARFLAPIALVAVAVATYLIVHGSLNTHTTTVTHSTQLLASGHRVHGRRKTPKFYVVEQGDTLSGISTRMHVSVAHIMALNPSLNPNALQTGQRLRLRR
jgi:peptidoglycan DL-endopeptidase LytE